MSENGFYISYVLFLSRSKLFTYPNNK